MFNTTDLATEATESTDLSKYEITETRSNDAFDEHVVEQQVTIIDDRDVAKVVVSRWMDDSTPWSPWNVYVQIDGDPFTVDQTIDFSRALMRAALTADDLKRATES